MRGLTAVTLGGLTANLAGYLLQLAAGRWLGVAGYSGFASLLAVQLLLAVPALAVQNVIAREVVRGAPIQPLRRLADRCTVLVAAAGAALIPLLSGALQVSATAATAAVLSAPALVLLAGVQGLLQGRERFRGLAVLLVLAGTSKLPAIAVLAAGGGATAALAVGSATLTGVAVVARRYSAGDPAADVRHRPDPQLAVPPAGRATTSAGVVAVGRASLVQLALIALAATDLIAARVLLDPADASRYALGAVAAKVAFWLPQAVGVVAYPRMAQPDGSARAVRTTIAVLAGLGVVTVGGAAAAAPLAPALVGADYLPVQGLLWLFALNGACLAVLQGALLAAIAAERTRTSAVVWIALPVEIAAAAGFADSVTRLIVIATTTSAVTALIGCVLAVRGSSVGRSATGPADTRRSADR
ncbi:polysaccharide biosynthesis protein [Skermania piniformis]|nr:polysaccharide biosynthesis protein [Skermania piniformis]